MSAPPPLVTPGFVDATFASLSAQVRAYGENLAATIAYAAKPEGAIGNGKSKPVGSGGTGGAMPHFTLTVRVVLDLDVPFPIDPSGKSGLTPAEAERALVNYITVISPPSAARGLAASPAPTEPSPPSVPPPLPANKPSPSAGKPVPARLPAPASDEGWGCAVC